MLTTTLILLLIWPTKVSEQGITETKSPPTIETAQIQIKIYRSPIKALKALKDNTADFYEAGEQFGVSPLLLMAIGIHESSGGEKIPPDSFNPFGRICDKGYECVMARDASSGKMAYWIKFRSFKEAIFDEAEYLKTRYFDKGFDTVDKIGEIYAEDPQWSSKIELIILKLCKNKNGK